MVLYPSIIYHLREKSDLGLMKNRFFGMTQGFTRQPLRTSHTFRYRNTDEIVICQNLPFS